MVAVLSITGVVFILIALGYLSVRLSLFSAGEMATLGKYVVNFALPALIFRAVAGRDLGAIVDTGALGAYLAASVILFAAGYLWSRRLAGLTPMAGTFQGMGVSCANSGFFGYPITLMAIPAIAPAALAHCMIVENLVMIPLVLVMAERSRGGAGGGSHLARQIAGRLSRNPIVLALFAGLAVSLAKLPIPEVIAETIELVARSSAAVSLVVIGGTLAGLKLSSLDTRWLPVVAGKLLLHPLAVWLGMLAAAGLGFAVDDPSLFKAMIVFAAMPPMSIYPILAQRYGEQDGASLVMLVMTGLSFFTISGLLWLLEAVPAG